MFDGTSDDDGGSVTDVTGGVDEVPLTTGVEDGGNVTGTLTVSDEVGISVLFPLGVGAGVDVETNVDVGPTLSVEFKVGANVGVWLALLEADVGTDVGVPVDSVPLEVVPGFSILVMSGISPLDEDGVVLGVAVTVASDVVASEIGVADDVAVAEDSVALAVVPGSKMLVKPGIRPLAELELEIGVDAGVDAASETDVLVGVAVPVSVSVGVSVVAVPVEDGITVAFDVVDEPGNKTLVRSPIKPPLLEVDMGVEVELAVAAELVAAVPVPVSVAVGEDGVSVDELGDKTLVKSSMRPPLLEVVFNVSEDDVAVEDALCVDVVVTAPVGNNKIPDEEDAEVDSEADSDSLVASSELVAVVDEVAFGPADESGVSEGNDIKVGIDKIGSLVLVASSFTVDDLNEDSSFSLELDFVVEVASLAVVVAVVASVSFFEVEPVAEGETKTVVGTTIVVVPPSSSEDVSSPRPRLARISDIVFLLVDEVEDSKVATSVEALD